MILKETELYGLVLSGGQSTRMGQDKSQINYYGKPQVEHLFDLLSNLLPKTFVSVRKGQEVGFTNNLIEDQLDTKGPINGIISAMMQYPGKSWLVLACDLPLVNQNTLKKLTAERDVSKKATAFATQKTNLPETLVAIWEYQALEDLKIHHLEEGKNCPRKFLLNTDIKQVYPDDDVELYNANNPEEYQEALKIIQ